MMSYHVKRDYYNLAISAWAAAHNIYYWALGPVLGVHRQSIWTHNTHYQVLSIVIRLSHSVHGVNQKAALVSHNFLASLCDVVVHVRRLRFSDSVDVVGMGSSSALICPVRWSFQTTVALTFNLSAPSQAGRAHATLVSMRNATWLILPIVICLSQRLSHACGLTNIAFRTLPAPYEKSKFLGFGESMAIRLKLKGIDGMAPPGVNPAA
ncbi:hypothetical protein BC332_34233 [Capsicum chinense]|nr:hypothetical protein BC332_34233 [Capsicum chinense]